MQQVLIFILLFLLSFNGQSQSSSLDSLRLSINIIPGDMYSNIAFTEDEKYMISYGWSSSIGIIDLKTKNLLKTKRFNVWELIKVIPLSDDIVLLNAEVKGGYEIIVYGIKQDSIFSRFSSGYYEGISLDNEFIYTRSNNSGNDTLKLYELKSGVQLCSLPLFSDNALVNVLNDLITIRHENLLSLYNREFKLLKVFDFSENKNNPQLKSNLINTQISKKGRIMFVNDSGDLIEYSIENDVSKILNYEASRYDYIFSYSKLSDIPFLIDGNKLILFHEGEIFGKEQLNSNMYKCDDIHCIENTDLIIIDNVVYDLKNHVLKGILDGVQYSGSGGFNYGYVSSPSGKWFSQKNDYYKMPVLWNSSNLTLQYSKFLNLFLESKFDFNSIGTYLFESFLYVANGGYTDGCLKKIDLSKVKIDQTINNFNSFISGNENQVRCRLENILSKSLSKNITPGDFGIDARDIVFEKISNNGEVYLYINGGINYEKDFTEFFTPIRINAFTENVDTLNYDLRTEFDSLFYSEEITHNLQCCEDNHLRYSSGKFHLDRCKTGLLYITSNIRKFPFVKIAFFEDQNYFINLTGSPHYMCSKDASKMLYYVTPSLKVLGFDQLDPIYNRPDIVLDSIGQYFDVDQELIVTYRDVWEKRIERLGLDKEKLGKGEIAVPNAEIVGAEDIAYENTSGQLELKLEANDPKYTLSRFNILVNEVPLYGSDGISIASSGIMEWDTTITVPLGIGENKIQVSVMNELGLENFKYPTYVNYTPEKDIIAKTYYIGIGVNAFKDSSHNLEYCVKDVRDLAKVFSSEKKNIDTLLFTDKQVTKENILALKDYLKKTSVNDKVIISCSSHGLLDDSLNFYLAMYDVDFNNPKARGLKYKELENLLDGIPARQKLLLLDACNSGENDKTELLKKELIQNEASMDSTELLAARGLIIKLKEENKSNFEKMNELFVNVQNNTGSVIISAAGGQESALEAIEVDDRVIENGAFTYSIIECLNQNKGQELKVNTLKQYAEKRVEEITNGNQKPTSRQETMDVDWKLL